MAGAEAKPRTTLSKDQHRYRPSAIRGLRGRSSGVLPDLGTRRISSSDVRRLVTRLQGEGLSDSRVGTSSTARGYLSATGTMRRNIRVGTASCPMRTASAGASSRLREEPRSLHFRKRIARCGRPGSFHAADAVLARQVR